MHSETAPKLKKILSFNEAHSVAIRIWHWITAVTLSASILTVILGSTMFRTRNNIDMVQEQLQGKGVTVTVDQAKSVAHEYSDKLWMTHKWIGYGLCILWVCRMTIEMAASRQNRLVKNMRDALNFKTNTSSEREERFHYLSVKSSYLIFYTIFFLMAMTGLGLAFEDAPILKDIHGPIKEIHEFLQYAIYVYVLFHLVGVIRADLGKHRGIVSRMISGNGQ